MTAPPRPHGRTRPSARYAFAAGLALTLTGCQLAVEFDRSRLAPEEGTSDAGGAGLDAGLDAGGAGLDAGLDAAEDTNG